MNTSTHGLLTVAKRVSDSTIRRLSHYLRGLESLERAGEATVSSDRLAEHGGTTAAQVRKDLSHFGSFGKRGLGYSVTELGGRLRGILGLDKRWSVALVGAGRIGRALYEYPSFRKRGFDWVAVFDNDPAKVGKSWGDLTIEHVEGLEAAVRRLGVELVVIAVPADAAQDVAARSVTAGAEGVLNFAPTQLRTPRRVPVADVNLVMEMEALSFAITQAGDRG